MAWFSPGRNCPTGAATLIFIIILLFGSIIIKILVTVWTLVSHPLTTIRAVPENWMRSAFCLDSAIAPEFVPGTRSYLRAHPKMVREAIFHDAALALIEFYSKYILNELKSKIFII